MVKVVYFGGLQETTNKREEIIKAADLIQLKELLLSMYPALVNSTFSIAVNKEIIHENKVLNTNDEVALLPPYSGG